MASIVVTLFSRGVRGRRNAGAYRPTVKMHGAGAAQRDATAELRSSQPHNVAQDPQQRHVARHIECVFLIIDA